MLKFAVIVSLMLIGSSMWAASLSCDSCGSECTSACGTRHFRSCCFNYLRRKRGPDPAVKFTSQNSNDLKSQDLTKNYKQIVPLLLEENIPEQWANMPSDYRPYPYEDIIENRFFDA